MDVEIKEARAHHLPHIAGIQAVSRRGEARMGIHTCMSPDELSNLIRDDDVPFLVARRGEAVVGYAYGLVEDGRCLVDQIAVRPDVRGRGTADELLEGIENAIGEYVDLSVAEIISDNLRSQRFFERSGYVLDSVRPGPESLSWQIWVKPLDS